jgi:hypothetical protein
VVDGAKEPLLICDCVPYEYISSFNFAIGFSHFLESPRSAALSRYIQSNQNELEIAYWCFENEGKDELIQSTNFEKSNPSLGVTVSAAYLNEKLIENSQRAFACHFGIEKE